MDRLSCCLCEVKRWDEAADLCQRLLALDPCQEEVQRRLMLCYQALGQRSKAMRQFKTCCEVLNKELAAKPSPATRRLYDVIARGSGPIRIKRHLSAD